MTEEEQSRTTFSDESACRLGTRRTSRRVRRRQAAPKYMSLSEIISSPHCVIRAVLWQAATTGRFRVAKLGLRFRISQRLSEDEFVCTILVRMVS